MRLFGQPFPWRILNGFLVDGDFFDGDLIFSTETSEVGNPTTLNPANHSFGVFANDASKLAGIEVGLHISTVTYPNGHVNWHIWRL